MTILNQLWDVFGSLNSSHISNYANAAIALLTAATAFYAALQIRLARDQQQDQSLFYLHQYLASQDFSDARLHVREKLAKLPYDKWEDADRAKANSVAASYDQAGILLNTRIIGPTRRATLLNSSWGESICDQYELLSAYLNDMRTPAKSGREYFAGFGKLYAETSAYKPCFLLISGGQTGVDQGALVAAAETNIKCAGWIPRNWATENSKAGKPEEIDSQLLRQLRPTESSDPDVRTALNVMWATHTIILYTGNPSYSDGTARAKELCVAWGKTYKEFSMDDPSAREQVVAFMNKNKSKRILLNVAGPRESSSPGIQKRTAEFLSEVLPVLAQLVPPPKKPSN